MFYEIFVDFVMYRECSFHWLFASLILYGLVGSRCDDFHGNKIEIGNSKPEQLLCIGDYGTVGKDSFTYR